MQNATRREVREMANREREKDPAKPIGTDPGKVNPGPSRPLGTQRLAVPTDNQLSVIRILPLLAAI